MSGHVQIVLREDVDNLGKSGDLVRVRAGYARNYLLPRGMAVAATRGNIERIEHERKVALAHAAKLREAAKAEASKLDGLKVRVAKNAGDEGKLYGSVTAQDVADALKAMGHAVDRRKIHMPDDAIKTTGNYDLSVKFGSDVSAKFVLEVVTAS